MRSVTTTQNLEQLRDEILILVSLDHPNIVRLEEVYESQSEIFLVFERLEGGELFDRLDEQLDYKYSEVTATLLVSQMLSAVRYCHSKKIVHRDLKLENFLFTSTAEAAPMKLIDFGLSKHFDFSLGGLMSDPVGTPYTVAPEVILGRCAQLGSLEIFLLSFALFSFASLSRLNLCQFL